MAPSQVRVTRFSFGKLIDHVLIFFWVWWKALQLSGRGAWWLFHAPVARVVVVVGTLRVVAWWQVGPVGGGVACVMVAAGLAVWFQARPNDFRAWWRAQYRYHFKIRPKWDEAMRSARLMSTDGKHQDRLSKVVGVSGNEHCDFVEVAMLPYQIPALYQKRVDGIRRHLGYVGGRAVERSMR